jgi:hypothetical protein
MRGCHDLYDSTKTNRFSARGFKLTSGHYYDTALTNLLAHYDAVVLELATLEAQPGKLAGYNAKRKRAVVRKLRESIEARLRWHAEQLAVAEAHGFIVEPEGPRREGPAVAVQADARA